MNKLSRATLVIGYCLIFFTGVVYYPKWKQPATEATLSWDVSGYYLYLPAVFIYHDLKQCRFKDSVLHKYHPTPDFQQAFRHSSGNYIMKYPAGQAILLSPFFFVGHIYALTSGRYPADGFSYPYQIAIGIGMLLYAFIGLWLLRKILLEYFSDTATAVTLLTLVCATNYLDYAAIDGAMTHNTLFTIYVILLFCCSRFYKKPTLKQAALIGLLAGLATLTRPTEVIGLLLPLLWGIKNIRELKTRIWYLKNNFRYVIIVLTCFVLVVSIQLVYWKWASGQWIIYTYGEEGFNWLHPHFIDALISFKAGWLIYSPVMILSIIGFLYLFRYYREHFYFTFIFILIFCYLCFSWKEWWYGASLGQRAMIQSYPVLAFPIAALVEKTISSRLWKVVLSMFILLCIYYNLWLTHQAHRGGLFRAGEMNSAFLMATIGRYHVSRDVESLLDNKERYTGSQAAVPILTNTELIMLGKDNQLPGENFFTAPANCNWIRAYAVVSTPKKEWDLWKMPQFIIKFYRNGSMVKTNFIRISRLLSDGEKGTISLDARLPVDSIDRISVSFWNAGSDKQVFISNIVVVGFGSK